MLDNLRTYGMGLLVNQKNESSRPPAPLPLSLLEVKAPPRQTECHSPHCSLRRFNSQPAIHEQQVGFPWIQPFRLRDPTLFHPPGSRNCARRDRLSTHSPTHPLILSSTRTPLPYPHASREQFGLVGFTRIRPVPIRHSPVSPIHRPAHSSFPPPQCKPSTSSHSAQISGDKNGEIPTFEKGATSAFCPLRPLRRCPFDGAQGGWVVSLSNHVFAFKCLLVAATPRQAPATLQSAEPFGRGVGGGPGEGRDAPADGFGRIWSDLPRFDPLQPSFPRHVLLNPPTPATAESTLSPVTIYLDSP